MESSIYQSTFAKLLEGDPSDQRILSILENVYYYVHWALLGALLVLMSYFVAWKLRFKLDKYFLLILFTQLAVLIARVFLKSENSVSQSIIMVCGDVVFKVALYFFVFEMQYVSIKLESTTPKEYYIKKRRVKWAKAAVIVGLIFIQLPIAIASYVVSTVQNYNKYIEFHLPMLIIVRTCVLLIDAYMFSLFGYLLKFYVRK